MGDSSSEPAVPSRRQDALPALSKGSEKPVLRKYKTALYSTRVSPYCMRVRLILNQKKHPFQLVNINIWEKPEWFVGMTELNLVPVLVDPDGSVIYESLIIAEYIDNLFAGKRLLSLDRYARAQEKILLNEIMGLLAGPIKNLAFKGAAAVDETFRALEKIEELLTQEYFFSERVGFVDLMIYPWFDRLPAYLKVAGSSYELVEKRFPKLAAWRTRMLQEPYVQETAYPDELYVASLEMRRTGTKDPDVGLDL